MKSPPEISLDGGDDSVDGENSDNINNIDNIDQVNPKSDVSFIPNVIF